MTLEEFGYVGPNDWPLVVACKWKIYGTAADHYRDKYQKAPVFRTANAATKMLRKLYRETKPMKTKPLTTVQLGVLLSGTSRFDMVRTLRRTGYATDGRFLFRPDKTTRQKIICQGLKRQKSHGKPIPKESIQRTLAVQYDPIPATTVSERTDTWDVTKTFYRLESSGNAREVNAAYFETIRRYHPNAQVHLPTDKNSPVVFVKKDKVVAALMPLAIEL